MARVKNTEKARVERAKENVRRMKEGIDLSVGDTALARRIKGGVSFPVRGVDPSVWYRFRLKCLGEGVSANQKLLQMITEEVGAHDRDTEG